MPHRVRKPRIWSTDPARRPRGRPRPNLRNQRSGIIPATSTIYRKPLPPGPVLISLILVSDLARDEGILIIGLLQKRNRLPCRGLHPGPPPTPNANGPCPTFRVRLPPLRDPFLAAQRYLSPPPDRDGTAWGATLAVPGLPGPRLVPAARRDLPATPAIIPRAGSRPACAPRPIPESVPSPGPVGLQGGTCRQ